MAAAVTKDAVAALSAFLDDGTLLCIMNDKCMEKSLPSQNYHDGTEMRPCPIILCQDAGVRGTGVEKG